MNCSTVWEMIKNMDEKRQILPQQIVGITESGADTEMCGPEEKGKTMSLFINSDKYKHVPQHNLIPEKLVFK